MISVQMSENQCQAAKVNLKRSITSCSHHICGGSLRESTPVRIEVVGSCNSHTSPHHPQAPVCTYKEKSRLR